MQLDKRVNITLRIEESFHKQLDDKRLLLGTTFQEVGVALLAEWLAGKTPAARSKARIGVVPVPKRQEPVWVEGGIREIANLDSLAACRLAKTDRFSRIMAKLLDDRDERFLMSARGGSPALALRLRRERRGIYFQYVSTFAREASRVQQQRVEAQTVTLSAVYAFNFHLGYLAAGMIGAGLMNLFRIPKAAAVADYFVERALPLMVPDAIG